MQQMNSIAKSLAVAGFSLFTVGTLLWSDFSKRRATLDEGELDFVLNPYILQSTSLPTNNKFNPTIANGFLGHAIYSKNIYMNGLYNGAKGDCHRARIPGTLPYIDIKNMTLKVLNSSAKIPYDIHPLYSMDMQAGTFTQRYELVKQRNGDHLCSVHQRFYAHRYLTRILVTDITIECVDGLILTVPLQNSHGETSDDIIIQESKEIFVTGKEFKLSCGRTKIPEETGSQTLKICYVAQTFPGELTLRAGRGENRTLATYISSVSGDRADVKKFLKIAARHITKGTLLKSHKNRWTQSWDNGNIHITSPNKFFDASVVSGLYYLLSIFPPMSMHTFPYEFFGASPGGLTNGGANQDYWGHVFWDQDFWMLPALLPLFPDAVEHGLRYRIARLQAAMQKAQLFGFEGAFYPWESAYTGFDVCPGETYVKYEQHVTGDVIHILKQYVYLTGKWDVFLAKVPCFPRSENCSLTAWDMTYQTARFWFSRFVLNKNTNRYEIRDVMGPDEYYAPVNNSAFTNVIAMQNLKFAVEVAEKFRFNLPEREAFLRVANNVCVPFDTRMNFHPEFDEFRPYYDIVKQADTIMLGFPLGYDMSFATRDIDLSIYSYVTDPGGPAMTWSMFSINFNERENYVAADEHFLRQFEYIQEPFQIWSESPNGEGAVNFLTGIGGYLQSILYGYLQLRIYNSYVTLKPRLPPTVNGDNVDEMVINGLKIHGISVDVTIARDTYSIKISKSIKRQFFLDILADERYYLSNVNDTVTLPTSVKCYITAVLMFPPY